MKPRLGPLSFVLLVGFIAYLLISRAPLRVHVATALTWVPSLLFLSVLAWERRLDRAWKLILMGAVLLAAGGLMAYSTALVVAEATFTVRLWLAYTALLLIGFGFVMALTHLCERILIRLLLNRTE